MNLLDNIVASLAPTLRTLAGQFGARVAVYRVVETRSAAGEVTRTYPAVDPTLSDIAVFLHAKREGEAGVLPSPTAFARPQGIARSEIGSAMFPPLESTGALPVLNALDGLKVLSGPFTGYTYLCETDSGPDTAGTFTVVPLLGAPAGKIV